jgi:hypothetical protein
MKISGLSNFLAMIKKSPIRLTVFEPKGTGLRFEIWVLFFDLIEGAAGCSDFFYVAGFFQLFDVIS